MFGDAAVAAAQIGGDKSLRVHMFNVFFFFLLGFQVCLSKTLWVEPQYKKSFIKNTKGRREIAKVMKQKTEKTMKKTGRRRGGTRMLMMRRVAS